MSAITTFLERPDLAEQTAEAGLHDFGDDAPSSAIAETIAGQAASIARFVWTRSIVAEWLRERKWWMEREDNEYVIRIDQPLIQDLVPYSLTAGNALKDRFPIWSKGNSKMVTHSWDLPAGAPQNGGTCPGAIMAQPSLDPETRIKHGLTPDGSHLRIAPPGMKEQIPFREASCICLYCYAEGKRMLYTDVQAAMLLRAWWCEYMTAEGHDDRREEWLEIMADSLTNPELDRPRVSRVTLMVHGKPKQFRAVRVHSSGDFMSQSYARAWVELAVKVAEIEDARDEEAPLIFWAPTRTWSTGSWLKEWPKILAPIAELAERRGFVNFVVRPSAYHVDDPAPFALAPGNAAGTTTTAVVNTPRRGLRSLYDMVCPAYETEDGGSCEENGCRKCWIEPFVRINYPLH